MQFQDYCCYANSKLYLVGEKVSLVSLLQWVHRPTLPLLPENALVVNLSFFFNPHLGLQAVSENILG